MNHQENNSRSGSPTSADTRDSQGYTAAGIDNVSRQRHTSDTVTVSRGQLDAIQGNLKAHPWNLDLKAAPEGLEWEMPKDVRTASWLECALEKCGMYDATQQRWNLGSDMEELGLVHGFHHLLENLVVHFPEIKAKCFPINMGRDPNALNKSSPLLRIDISASVRLPGALATGQSDLALPAQVYCMRYCGIPVEVRTGQKCSFTDDALKLQMALYARCCFACQPDRRSVSCLLLTEKSLYVYQFDHNGFHITRPFNIHTYPILFIYVIFHLANEVKQPPLDYSIFCDKSGQTYMRIPHQHGTSAFKMIGPLSALSPIRICGRATLFWRVQSNTGQNLFVKSSWDEPEFESEKDFLVRARGLAGVAQIVAVTTGTTGYRVPTFTGARLHRLLMVEYYERSIHEFKSKREFLYILRDAIEGHRNLWNIGICHRDICPKNIRIRTCGHDVPFTEGTQGILTGLDKAKRVGELAITMPKSRDVVNRNAFQSMNVLRASQVTPSHDFPDLWDDLESFFYVICFICNIYAGRTDLQDSPRRAQFRDTWNIWSSADPSVSGAAKLAFCASALPPDYVAPYFGPIFREMLENMRAYIHWHTMDVWSIHAAAMSSLLVPCAMDLRGYTYFLDFINRAITEINVRVNQGLPQ